MTTVAHLPALPDFERKDDWGLACPAGESSSSSQCPFISNPSTASSSSSRRLLPPGHPPVPSAFQAASEDRIGATNIRPTLPPLPTSPTVDSAEVTKGNFAHLFSQDLDLPSAALQHALKDFRAVGEGYSTASYDTAFNWEDLRLPIDIHREWYCVVFRSRRHPTSSNVSLYSADRAAHYEAIEGGGLVMYWYGEPDSDGRNLATCIWQSRGQALEATKGPKHINAMRQASKAYESYTLERWVLRKEEGEEEVSVVPWQSGEVDFGSSVEA